MGICKGNFKVKEEKTKTFVIESEDFLKKLASSAQGGACLVLIEGRPLGRKFPLLPPKVCLGRGKKADLSIDDQSVSQVHSEVVIKNQQVFISDLGSTNGTFVNDARITRATLLKEGDSVRIGTTIFKFLPAGNIENIYHEKMRDLATIDDLTQIFNKKYIVDYLQSEFVRCRSLRIPLSLIMFDIDFFKQVNDRYGHLAGDYVLRKACALLKDRVLRTEDVFGRYGGEEFVVILPGATLQKACEIAERLRATVEKFPFEYDGQPFPVTISLGVGEMDISTKTPEDLIKKIDAAL
ncbi:MAG: GGDEF domain-containing protein, partial [Deltaproteobacteria bacterium]|nr:GGDEF domain-containing protein [Deltaproteobacteria bacterium]